MEDIIQDLMHEVKQIESLREDSLYRVQVEYAGISLDMDSVKEIIAFYQLHKECKTSQALKPFIKS